VFSITMLDEDYKPIYIVNSFDDLLWTERFLTVGSFKLILSHISNKILEAAKYVIKSDSVYIGVIMVYELSDKAVIEGRFMESVLSSRFGLDSVNYTGNAETVIRDIVRDTCILGDRAIERLELAPTATDIGGAVSINLLGKNVLEVIEGIQLEQALSIRITYDFEAGKLLFSVWEGRDMRDNVLLSRDYDNILTEKYRLESVNVKNYAVVDGSGEGAARTRVIVDNRNGAPKNELYVDARHLQPTAGQSGAAYQTVLADWGHQKLREFAEIQTIDLTIDYKKAYMLQLGDVVTYKNGQYDIIAEGQITEFQDVAGSEIKKIISIGKERINIIQALRRLV